MENQRHYLFKLESSISAVFGLLVLFFTACETATNTNRQTTNHTTNTATHSNTANTANVGNERATGNGDNGGVPEFPWPPTPSTKLEINLADLRTRNPKLQLNSIAEKFERVLQKAGYEQRGYYGTPGGFALVSQYEQFKADGSQLPPELRWSETIPSSSIFSVDRWRDFLNGKVGRFRTIIIAATNQPFRAGTRKPTKEDAQAMPNNGADRLSPPIAALPVTAEHKCYILIYEFEVRAATQNTIFVERSAIPATRHLAHLLPLIKEEFK